MKNILKSFQFEKLRNIEKLNYINDGNRSIFESILLPEISDTLKDWKENNNSDFVLIGGVALSYYIKPRYTTDVDVLYLLKEQIPNKVNKFKYHRVGAFQHNKTHAEVEVVIPTSINVPIYIAKSVFDTCILRDGIKIASPSGLVALKLYRFNRQDQADIEQLKIHTNIDLSIFGLPENLLSKFNSI